VVVDSYRQLALGSFLPDYVLIQKVFNFKRFRNFMGSSGRRFRLIVFQDRVADGDTFIANICPCVIAGGRNQLTDYVLALMTKRTP
jgi:hypothetical protein